MHYLYRFCTSTFPVLQNTDVKNEQFNNHKEIILENDPPNLEISPFPPVNTRRFNSSAKQYKHLLEEAQLLINKILSSPKFARALMHEAQLSEQENVDALIASSGIRLKVNTIYNPSSIRIEIYSEAFEQGCCQLHMTLRW